MGKKDMPRLLSGADGVHGENEEEGTNPPATPAATTTPTATTVAAAAADDEIDQYDDDDEAQANADDALLASRAVDRSTGGNCRTAQKGERAREKAGVLMAMKIMLGSDESASFFMAVVLSGMGSGVIDTFLFIR